jgi:phosphatidylinositol 4-kinase
MKLQLAEASAIRDKIMQEMMALEEERMERMKEPVDASMGTLGIGESRLSARDAEDESIVRKELNKVDPSGKYLVWVHDTLLFAPHRHPCFV